MPNDFVSVIKPTAKAGEVTGEIHAIAGSVPVLPVRDTVLFPHAVLPLTVGRESSIQLIQSLGEEKTILVVAQRDARLDTPEGGDLHAVGTRATVHKVVKMPNQSLFVFTEGNERVRLGAFTQMQPFMMAEFDAIAEIEPAKSPELEALQRNVVSQFQQIVTSSPTLSDDLQTIAINIDEPGRLSDFIASSLPFLTTADKQELLETPEVAARLERINKHLAKELEVQQLRNKIQTEVQDSVQQSQRDYYLREQMKAISEGTWGPRRYPERHCRPEREDRERRYARGGAEGCTEGAWSIKPDEPGGGGLLADAATTLSGWPYCRGQRRARARSIF